MGLLDKVVVSVSHLAVLGQLMIESASLSFQTNYMTASAKSIVGRIFLNTSQYVLI